MKIHRAVSYTKDFLKKNLKMHLNTEGSRYGHVRLLGQGSSQLLRKISVHSMGVSRTQNWESGCSEFSGWAPHSCVLGKGCTSGLLLGRGWRRKSWLVLVPCCEATGLFRVGLSPEVDILISWCLRLLRLASSGLSQSVFHGYQVSLDLIAYLRPNFFI